jgi:hypothetical protein
MRAIGLVGFVALLALATAAAAVAQDKPKKKRPPGYCTFEACVARGKAKGYASPIPENWCRANNNAC